MAGAGGVSEDFRDQFRCVSCKKYLRPPVITCEKGHNICKHCHTSMCATSLVRAVECPKEKCTYTKPLVQNATIEAMMKALKLPVTCRYGGCAQDLSADEIYGHEEERLHREIFCPVLNCRREVKPATLDRHLRASHEAMMNGKWQVLSFDSAEARISLAEDGSSSRRRRRRGGAAENAESAGSNGAPAASPIKMCAMKVGMQSGDKRGFAYAVHKEDFWHVWTMHCGSESQARKFSCEIRLHSDMQPFSNTFRGPIVSIESPLFNKITSAMFTFFGPRRFMFNEKSLEKFCAETGCFTVHSHEVLKHIPTAPSDPEDVAVPFTCKVIETQSPVDGDLCIMCQDRRPEVVLAPCGHQNVCGPCAHEWNGRPPRDGGGSCPFCRQPITMIVSPIPL